MLHVNAATLIRTHSGSRLRVRLCELQEDECVFRTIRWNGRLFFVNLNEETQHIYRKLTDVAEMWRPA